MAAVAVVTGGVGGIGSAICDSLAQRRYAVIAGDREAEQSEATSFAAGTVTPTRMDVTDDESVRLIAERAATAGKLTAVVNCAGILREARADGMAQGLPTRCGR